VPKKIIDEKIDELALAVGRGFDELRQEVRDGFAAVSKRFDAVEQRLESVEFLVSGQDRRISILEDKMRMVSVKIGLEQK
jgi:hypothetical protein